MTAAAQPIFTDQTYKIRDIFGLEDNTIIFWHPREGRKHEVLEPGNSYGYRETHGRMWADGDTTLPGDQPAPVVGQRFYLDSIGWLMLFPT